MVRRRKVARDYAAVLEFVKSLPPPEEGLVRVFRGQTRHYDKILPTAYRGPLKRRPQWYVSVQLLAKHLTGPTDEPEYDSERVARIVEAEAAIQHYGEGSQYLDVTHNLAIALWFALHVSSRSDYQLSFPATGDGAPLLFTAPVTCFSRQRRSGVLYVFDVQDWCGRPIRHGRLFDILEVSNENLVSERARRQSGCLLYAEGNGDLSAYLAAEPLQVGWPMRGAPPELFADSDYIFPPPQEDPILDGLLQFPLVPDLSESSEGRGRLQHPLDVQIYEPSDWSDYEARISCLSKPLILPALRATVVDGGWDEQILEALPILMEAPMIAIREDASWNDEVLLASLADKIRPRHRKSFNRRAQLDLRNIFVEFSPLEIQRWLDPDDEFVVPRGLWLLRDGPEMWVTASAEFYRGRTWLEALAFGPYEVSIDSNGTLALEPLYGDPDELLQSWVAKALRPVLALLRDLNPKESKYAYMVEMVGGGMITRYTPELGQIADLVPASVTYQGLRYFIPKAHGSDEPYTGYF